MWSLVNKFEAVMLYQENVAHISQAARQQCDQKASKFPGD